MQRTIERARQWKYVIDRLLIGVAEVVRGYGCRIELHRRWTVVKEVGGLVEIRTDLVKPDADGHWARKVEHDETVRLVSGVLGSDHASIKRYDELSSDDQFAVVTTLPLD